MTFAVNATLNLCSDDWSKNGKKEGSNRSRKIYYGAKGDWLPKVTFIKSITMHGMSVLQSVCTKTVCVRYDQNDGVVKYDGLSFLQFSPMVHKLFWCTLENTHSVHGCNFWVQRNGKVS